MSATLEKWKARAADVQVRKAYTIAPTSQGGREENRAAFPFTSQIVDELRAEGFAPRVVSAEEGGRSIGARRTDPATSHQAAERAREFAGKHAAAIFAYLTEHPEGATYREIATGIGMEPVAVGRRLKELQERAGVYAGGERGGMTVWRVAA